MGQLTLSYWPADPYLLKGFEERANPDAPTRGKRKARTHTHTSPGFCCEEGRTLPLRPKNLPRLCAVWGGPCPFGQRTYPAPSTMTLLGEYAPH
jgi:hypothetical protein